MGKKERMQFPFRIWVCWLISFWAATTAVEASEGITLYDYETKPAFYTTWTQFGPFLTEAKLTATLNSISNLNLATIYSPFCIIIDGGWSTTNRDANGRLQFDPEKFPGGTNIVTLIHAYGCKALLWTEAALGDITYSDGGTPTTWGTNVEWDAQTIAGWGFDGAKFDLAFDFMPGEVKVQSIFRFVNAFRAAAPNRQTYFYDDVGPGMDRDLFAKFPPGTVICENSENDPNDLVAWTQTMMTHLSNVNQKNVWSAGRECYEGWPYNAAFIKVWSIFGSPYVFTACYTGDYQDYRPLYNKPECIALNNDPLYAAPFAIFQSSTNLAVARRRGDGTITALALNLTKTETQRITLNFSELGLPSGFAADIREIYDEVDYGKASDSYSFDLGPHEAKLLRFDSEARPPGLVVKRSAASEVLCTVQSRPGTTVVLENCNQFGSWSPIAQNLFSTAPWQVPVSINLNQGTGFFRAVRQ